MSERLEASVLGYAFGYDVLVVGVEPDSDQPEMTRVYIGSRGRREYVLMDGENAEAVKRAWSNTMQHVLMPRPPAEAIHREATP